MHFTDSGKQTGLEMIWTLDQGYSTRKSLELESEPEITP